MFHLLPRRNREVGTRLPASPGSLWGGEMDRLLERLWGGFWPLSHGQPLGEHVWAPSIDVSETDTDVIVRADIPGVDPKTVEVILEGDHQVISGEKKESQENKEKHYHYSERFYGSFRRVLELPSAVDAESAVAEHKDGVLTLSLKKDPKLNPKKIPVKTS